ETLQLQPFQTVRVVGPAGQLAEKAADGLAEFVTAADALAAPERHQRGVALGRRYDHAVGVDALQPPGGGAQQEDVVDAALVDGPLVEFADADAAGRVNRVLAGVGDRAAAGEGELLAAGQGEKAVVDAVPADAWLEGSQR